VEFHDLPPGRAGGALAAFETSGLGFHDGRHGVSFSSGRAYASTESFYTHA
jgi:hypothetical protein